MGNAPGKNFNIALVVILIFLILVASIAFISLQKIETQIRDDVGKSLKIVLDTTIESHATWINKQKLLHNLYVKRPEFITLIRDLVTKSNNSQQKLRLTAEKLRIDFADSHLRADGNIGFQIISTDLVNIACMRKHETGKKSPIAIQYPELFESVLSGNTVLIPPVYIEPVSYNQVTQSSTSMYFATPIIENGRTLAVLAVEVDPALDFTRITQIGRIGTTGETYAFNKAGFIISDSRFRQQLIQVGLLKKYDKAILNVQLRDPGGNLLAGYKPEQLRTDLPFTVMAEQALAGSSGLNVDGYRDYRGVRVLGAWSWLAQYGYGLTTEIDETEALSSYTTTRSTIINLMVFTTLLSLTLISTIYWIRPCR